MAKATHCELTFAIELASGQSLGTYAVGNRR